MSFFAKLGSDSDSDSSSESEESLISDEEQPQKRNTMANKFLRTGSDDSSDDSDDSSDEEEEMSDSDDEGGNPRANKFLRGADSSDEDSDDEDRIRVLSAKDKR